MVEYPADLDSLGLHPAVVLVELFRGHRERDVIHRSHRTGEFALVGQSLGGGETGRSSGESASQKKAMVLPLPQSKKKC